MASSRQLLSLIDLSLDIYITFLVSDRTYDCIVQRFYPPRRIEIMQKYCLSLDVRLRQRRAGRPVAHVRRAGARRRRSSG